MRLVITADDYGYAPSCDRGIVEAAHGGAVDAVSAMVTRYEPDPAPLLGSGVEVGLHLELGPEPEQPPREPGAPAGAAGPRRQVERAVAKQVERFEAAFGAGPAHLDGHHHCHARGVAAAVVAEMARARGLPVRSVDDAHRQLLRSAGVRTADRLIGRVSEGEDALPPEVREVLRGLGARRGGASEGGELVEWMTHPGHPARPPASSYDAGREEDLRVLLELADEPALRAIRTAWRPAFT